jgi:selenocysteine lyase/cysteine desulfurase
MVAKGTLPDRVIMQLRHPCFLGYPTGVGALIMKQEFAKRLHRPYFGGGTVETVQVPGFNVTMTDGPRRFEV